MSQLTPTAPEMIIVEFANSIESDEAAHHELPRPDLQNLASSLCILNITIPGRFFFWHLADVLLVVCFLGDLRIKGKKILTYQGIKAPVL